MTERIKTAELERLALVLDRGFGNPTFKERHDAATALRELIAIRTHTAAQPAPDAVAEADAFDTFAQWFRKNYPGPDTIIHKPDWHSQRIFRAVKHAMKGSHP